MKKVEIDRQFVMDRLPGIANDVADALKQEALERLVLYAGVGRPNAMPDAVAVKNEHGVVISFIIKGDDADDSAWSDERARAVWEPVVAGAGRYWMAALRSLVGARI